VRATLANLRCDFHFPSLATFERRAGTANHADAVGAARKERPRLVPREVKGNYFVADFLSRDYGNKPHGWLIFTLNRTRTMSSVALTFRQLTPGGHDAKPSSGESSNAVPKSRC